MKLEKRFQLYIDNDLFQRLRTLCFTSEISIAEHIRRAVKAYLDALEVNNERTN